MTSQVKNQFFIEMDGVRESRGVLVLGATNLPEVLDKVTFSRSNRRQTRKKGPTLFSMVFFFLGFLFACLTGGQASHGNTSVHSSARF